MNDDNSNYEIEVVLETLKPLHITKTREIKRRQEEDELRKKYGVKKTKYGVVSRTNV
jgi:hypothetical protein